MNENFLKHINLGVVTFLETMYKMNIDSDWFVQAHIWICISPERLTNLQLLQQHNHHFATKQKTKQDYPID